jgi:hypothetical protein
VPEALVWVYCLRMAGQRQPGSWGLEATPVVIDEGTSARIRTPPPGSIGEVDSRNSLRERPEVGGGVVTGAAAEALETVNQTIERFRRSESWSRLQPVVFQVVGQYSFGLGVVYGIGENVIGSVVELGQLAKTFLLADLYDRAQQSMLTAAFGPTSVIQRLIAEVAMRTFGSELEEARRERDELIAEVRYAMTNLGEVFENVKAGYLAKWNRFEMLSRERTLSAKFEAGRIFGEVLLEVVSLIAGGAASLKAASKIPRLAKLARLRIPPKSAHPRAQVAGGAAAGEKPMTPSQARGPKAPRDIPEPAPKPRATPAPEADPPEILKRRQDNETLLKSDRFKEDQHKAGVTDEQLAWMRSKESPLGFKSPEQFNTFKSELRDTLQKAGLDDAQVEMKGTATTFYSENPKKPLGHHFDANPLEKGDLDFGIASPEVINRMEAAGKVPHPNMPHIYKTRDLMETVPELKEFSDKWGKVLGRDVNFVGRTAPTLPSPAPTDFRL